MKFSIYNFQFTKQLSIIKTKLKIKKLKFDLKFKIENLKLFGGQYVLQN